MFLLYKTLLFVGFNLALLSQTFAQEPEQENQKADTTTAKTLTESMREFFKPLSETQFLLQQTVDFSARQDMGFGWVASDFFDQLKSFKESGEYLCYVVNEGNRDEVLLYPANTERLVQDKTLPIVHAKIQEDGTLYYSKIVEENGDTLRYARDFLEVYHPLDKYPDFSVVNLWDENTTAINQNLVFFAAASHMLCPRNAEENDNNKPKTGQALKIANNGLTIK